MLTLAKDAREYQVRQVIEKTYIGASTSEACREIGIPCSTSYYFINMHPDMLTEVKQLFIEDQIETLLSIMEMSRKALDRIEEQLDNDTLSFKQLLSIAKYVTAA